jgi:BirA family biotin operon repressor/biotin-[acetyl-CoA-carboxylase] ligase
MLDKERLDTLLPVAGLGNQFSFHDKVGSTNDVALEWANQGALHGTLVIAGAQSAGRGQKGSTWITSSGCGLALSLILRPKVLVHDAWLRLHALGALAVVEALAKWDLDAFVKWPNDVLLEGKKVSGVLANVSWVGDQIEFVVLGIGVNVERDDILEAHSFDFPAISIGEVLGRQVDWHEMLAEILTGINKWYSLLNQRSFIEQWNKKLAFRGESVVVQCSEGPWIGTLVGLNDNGALLLRRGKEELIVMDMREVKLRPDDG